MDINNIKARTEALAKGTRAEREEFLKELATHRSMVRIRAASRTAREDKVDWKAVRRLNQEAASGASAARGALVPGNTGVGQMREAIRSLSQYEKRDAATGKVVFDGTMFVQNIAEIKEILDRIHADVAVDPDTINVATLKSFVQLAASMNEIESEVSRYLERKE